MPKVAIVSDSTCDLPEAWPQRQRVHIVPVHIRFGDASFREGIDITPAEFYARIERDSVIPQTSQPSPGEFVHVYRDLAQEYDAIISLHVTAKLSGTHQSAVLAAEMVRDEIPVYPFDSAAGAIGLGFMAMEAIQLLDADATVEITLDRLSEIRSRLDILLSPETLKYAQMSGRVSALGASLAALFNIKPIIVLTEGVLFARERVRTRKRALHSMVESVQRRLGDAPARVGVAHAQSPHDAAQLAESASVALNCDQVWTTDLATSIAVHLGPGTVGLVAYRL